MNGINKVILLGTLGKDPETRGKACALSIATNERWKDKATGEMQERTEWHRVKLFGRLAEIASEYLRKGRSVYIEGKLSTSKYTDNQGIERYTTDIIGDEMQLLGGAEAKPSSSPAYVSKPVAARASIPAPVDFDADIPF